MSTPLPSTRLTGIDALRGLAAISVVFYHYTTRYQQKFGFAEPPGIEFPFGHLGVNLFFVISGFVIFMTLERIRRPEDFVVSRFSRLFPTFWAAVLLTACVEALSQALGSGLSLPHIAANLLMVHEFLGFPSVDGVYWTLQVELFFYLWMFTLWLIGGLQRPYPWLGLWLLLSLAQGGVAGWSLPIPYRLAQLWLLPQIPFFVLGMAVYLQQSRGAAERFGPFALGIAALTVIYLSQGSELLAWAISFLVLLQLALRINARAERLARPVLWLGAVSYPLYLLHQNIGYTVIHFSQQWGANALIAGLLALLVALLLAGGVHRLVELPAMDAIRRAYKAKPLALPLNRWHWLGLALGLAIGLLGLSFALPRLFA